jgi:hypothetical protein
MSLVFILTGLYTLSFFGFMYLVVTATNGWQDKDGFHMGKKPDDKRDEDGYSD